MNEEQGPGWAPPGAGPPAEQADEPLTPGAGEPSWQAPPPFSLGSSPVEGLAIAAFVLAVVSLLVPLLPGLVALVLAAMAAQRIRQAATGSLGGRGLVSAALALSAIGLFAWLGLGALVVVTHQQTPTAWQATAATGPVGAGQFSEVTIPPATHPATPEPTTTVPATTQPKVAVGQVGDRLTVHDEFNTAQLEITVSRLTFWTGDEVDQPEHGLYMGAYVKVHALADEQDTPWEDSYALVGGHHYLGDAIITDSTAFDPPLDPVTLNQGEGTSGWLVFDVPARHGELVLRDILNERTLGIWKY